MPSSSPLINKQVSKLLYGTICQIQKCMDQLQINKLPLINNTFKGENTLPGRSNGWDWCRMASQYPSSSCRCRRLLHCRPWRRSQSAPRWCGLSGWSCKARPLRWQPEGLGRLRTPTWTSCRNPLTNAPSRNKDRKMNQAILDKLKLQLVWFLLTILRLSSQTNCWTTCQGGVKFKKKKPSHMRNNQTSWGLNAKKCPIFKP